MIELPRETADRRLLSSFVVRYLSLVSFFCFVRILFFNLRFARFAMRRILALIPRPVKGLGPLFVFAALSYNSLYIIHLASE